MINNETTIEAFIAKECSEHEETLWGSPCLVTPCLIEEITGDGLQVIYWGTIDQRPWYWVLRIDSKTDIDSDGFNQGDELYNLVRDQCGRYDADDDDDDVYPMIIDTMGDFWGVLKNFGKND